MEALLARIGQSEKGEVEALWSGMQTARASCESMAVRGQRLIREVAADWQVRREVPPPPCWVVPQYWLQPSPCQGYTRSDEVSLSTHQALLPSSWVQQHCMSRHHFLEPAIRTMQSEVPTAVAAGAATFAAVLETVNATHAEWHSIQSHLH
jgi:hypothetical protein